MFHGQPSTTTFSSFACSWLLWSYPIATFCNDKKKKWQKHTTPAMQERKNRKMGPSSNVYMLSYHVRKTWYPNMFSLNVLFLTLSSFVVCQKFVLHLLHPCPQFFQKKLNCKTSFWIVEKLGFSVVATVGAASTCLFRLFAQQQRMSYHRSFDFLDCQRRMVLCLVLLRWKRWGQKELKN
jgi:hypothetical protein